jgi:hypothetical protein
MNVIDAAREAGRAEAEARGPIADQEVLERVAASLRLRATKVAIVDPGPCGAGAVRLAPAGSAVMSAHDTAGLTVSSEAARTCGYCGADLAGRRPNVRYCSPSHRTLAWQKRRSEAA